MSGLEHIARHREQEHGDELEKTGHEQLERLRHELETTSHNIEKDAHADLKNLRHTAMEKAVVQENTKHQVRERSPAERRGPITHRQLDTQFNRTMARVRDELPTTSRVFSRIIHNQAVEKASDVIGSTIARPNALFFGAFCAFILTLGLYLFAKNMGYKLSGFETIGAFIIGWVFGILYDYLKIMVTGKK